MKKIFYIFIILLFLVSIDVSANTHDVKAKYNVTYNNTVYIGKINNNSININVDNYIFELTSSLEDVEVVIIKTDGDANNYAKSFSFMNENYYISFFKGQEKLTTGEINIRVTNDDKLLNIYDKDGNLINKSVKELKLSDNDYYITLTNKISDYIVTDIDTLVHELEEISNEDEAHIELYNYKNVKLDNYKTLGTGYRVLVTSKHQTIEYTIVVNGDINGDAQINLNDVTRLYHYYKNIEKMDDVFVKSGDVAKNDKINLNDITKLYHYYKGIISNF